MNHTLHKLYDIIIFVKGSISNAYPIGNWYLSHILPPKIKIFHFTTNLYSEGVFCMNNINLFPTLTKRKKKSSFTLLLN